MTARETLAVVLAIEALRLEVRSVALAPDRELGRKADQQASQALQTARQAVEAEEPAGHE